MASSRNNWLRVGRAAAGLIALHIGATPGLAAQRLLDLPIRAGGGPDALVTGAFAVFWNPAASGIPTGRGEAMVVDVQGPAATSLDGAAFAGLYRLDARTALGMGVRHSGLGEIPTTTTSPLPDEVAGAIDVGETTFGVMAARTAGSALVFGASAQFTRASRALGATDEIEVGAGLRRPHQGWVPGFGAMVRLGEAGADWAVGVEFAPAVARLAGARASLSYGLAGSPLYGGISHRVGLEADWSRRFRLMAGLAGEPGADGHAWDPTVGADLSIQRYTVGVLREQLANGVGAVHSFRLGVRF